MKKKVKRELDKVLGKLSYADKDMLGSWGKWFAEAKKSNNEMLIAIFSSNIGSYLDALVLHNIMERKDRIIIEEWYKYNSTSTLEYQLKEKNA